MKFFLPGISEDSLFFFAPETHVDGADDDVCRNTQTQRVSMGYLFGNFA